MSSLSGPVTAEPLVVVVDDDAALRELLQAYLQAHGWTVCALADGRALRQWVQAGGQPQVVVLDWMLPGEDGLALTRWLKAAYPQWPVLMLSARGEEVDKVVGLEVGADDYLPKPFGPRELLARLRALLRRSALPAAAGAAADARPDGVADAPQPAGQRLVFGPFVLDVGARRLWRQGREVELTTAEFELLAVMARRPQRVLTRDQLVQWLKGYERDALDRSMDNRITRLRRKIEPDPAHPVFIRTVRGEGYWFNPQGDGA